MMAWPWRLGGAVGVALVWAACGGAPPGPPPGGSPPPDGMAHPVQNPPAPNPDLIAPPPNPNETPARPTPLVNPPVDVRGNPPTPPMEGQPGPSR